jgi:hypothetical protein
MSKAKRQRAPEAKRDDDNPYLVSANEDGHVQMTMAGHCLLNIENARALATRLLSAADEAQQLLEHEPDEG